MISTIYDTVTRTNHFRLRGRK